MDRKPVDPTIPLRAAFICLLKGDQDGAADGLSQVAAWIMATAEGARLDVEAGKTAAPVAKPVNGMSPGAVPILSMVPAPRVPAVPSPKPVTVARPLELDDPKPQADAPAPVRNGGFTKPF